MPAVCMHGNPLDTTCRARRVFNVFLENQVSVDVVATSEISVSLTLDPGCATPLLLQLGIASA